MVIRLRILSNKKGQKLTLFFLLGLVIVGAAAFYQFSQDAVIAEVEVDDPVSFQLFVDSCIEDVLDDGLVELSSGSLGNGPRVSVGNVQYALLTAGEDVSSQLEGFVADGLPSCLAKDNALSFSGVPDVEVVIRSRTVLVDVNYKISLVEDGASRELDEFSIEKKLLLGEMLDSIDEIFSDGVILQSYVGDLGLVTQVLPTNQLFILLVDKEFNVRGKNYYLGFVKG
tara:strand:+ start:4700 stop:5380 length:681 start_codon:yes stop_codon:yes gene_type:complete